jgi:hypothetical protein
MPMSKPTPQEDLFRWHRNALLPEYERDESIPTTDEPQPGFYKRRLVKGGVYVPARIWVCQNIDEETGELTTDEQVFAEVNGNFADPKQQWSWLCGNPITEAEFNYMTARRQYAAQYASHEPSANPRQPVDWLHGVPIPTFTKESNQ